MIELWRDENKLFDLDGKGNGEAKNVRDHRRFWRGFIHKKIGDYEEQRMEKKPKLRTYRTFKTKLKLEKYLDVSNVKGRKLLTSLRSGSNTLEIEKGRWRKIDKNQRFCLQCDTKRVEDEKHMVVECERYVNERGLLFDQISALSEGTWNLRQMVPHNQFILLMAGTSDKYDKKISSAFQSFLVKCFKTRKNAG